jgi:hypothetical protein
MSKSTNVGEYKITNKAKNTGSIQIPGAVAVGQKLTINGGDPIMVTYVQAMANGNSSCYCKGHLFPTETEMTVVVTD